MSRIKQEAFILSHFMNIYSSILKIIINIENFFHAVNEHCSRKLFFAHLVIVKLAVFFEAHYASVRVKPVKVRKQF